MISEAKKEHRLHYVKQKHDNVIKNLGNGNHYDWSELQKKYFYKGLELIPFCSEARAFYDSMQFVSRREKQIEERKAGYPTLRKMLLLSAIIAIPALAPMIPFKKAFDILDWMPN